MRSVSPCDPTVIMCRCPLTLAELTGTLMPPITMQTTALRPITPPPQVSATTDVRVGLLDPLALTADQAARLHGQRCARCGSAANLRPGGYAYTSSGNDGGRLGWAVKLCSDCPGTGA